MYILGSDVSEYTAQHFPPFLKKTESWSKGQYGQALEDAFLAFDAHLRQPEAMQELRRLAGFNKKEKDLDGDSSPEDVEEEKAALFEESQMPLELLLQRYNVRQFFRNHRHDTVLEQEDGERTDNVSSKTRSAIKRSKGKAPLKRGKRTVVIKDPKELDPSKHFECNTYQTLCTILHQNDLRHQVL